MVSLGKILVSLVSAPILLLAVLLFRAEIYFPAPSNADTCNQTHVPIAGQQLVDRFREALRIRTITRGTGDYDGEPLITFAQFLRTNFPTIYASPLVTFETVNNYSLLYHVKGSDPNLKPYLLTSHLDVVPVELDKWDVDPFGGILENGYIYGRGSLDVKNTLMGIMEALEYLLKNGFKPQRSFYIAFGHDEEGFGIHGAQEIAKVFTARGINQFEYLLDEGMFIFNESVPGLGKNMVAIVGVAEKGMVSLYVRAKGQVGHSSMAPEDTAITRLGRAVSRLTGTSQPNLFGLGPEKDMIEAFANIATYPAKLVYSNLWLFGPLISRLLSRTPSSNAFVRTTTAVTVISGGFKENVLPSEAEAIVNHRIHPSQSVQEVIDLDHKLIDDPNIQLEIKGSAIEAHPISPYDATSFGYQTIRRSIGQVFEQTIAIPGILVATTDTRWYLKFTKAVYRFSPSVLSETDTKRFHGHNERISVNNYLKTVNFFHHLILNSDKKELDPDRRSKDEL